MLWKNVDSDVDYISGGIDYTTGYSERGWCILGIKILLVIGIYLVLMWLIAYNNDEKNMIKGVLKKIIHK